ncbi:PQQ-binding-like beta-propeller repeat protein [Candidatus Giovannonibacteria bacterium]|nr:PQQ-binding-like beta-propeller repeat protein [Candidatus Giovannonibacteria bacterium]
MEQKLEKLKNIIKRDALPTSKTHIIISPTGERENWLFDLRNIFLKPEALDLIVDIFWEKFEKEYPFQVGGQELAAVPLIGAIVLRSHQIGKPVNGFMIRKARKSIGLQKLIEGELDNTPIILVDDIINSGSTFLRQIRIIEETGKIVSRIFPIMNFSGNDDFDFIKKRNINLTYLFSLKDFGLSMSPKKRFTPQERFKIMWKFQAPDANLFHVVPKSTPCMDNEKIYFGSDNGFLWAINQNDGSVAWKYKVGYPSMGKSIFSSPAINKKMIYFGSYDGNFYCQNAKDGKIIWKYSEADWIGSSPALAPDLNLVFIGLEFGLFKRKGGIAALKMDTGEKIWDYKVPEYVHCSPAYCKEKQIVAIGGNDNTVYLFNAKNGTLLWKYETGGEIKASLAFDIETNLLLFGSFDKNEYALDLDTGNVIGKFKTEDIIYSSPVVRDSKVYFTSTDKNIYCFDLRTGEMKWQFATSGRIIATPNIIDGNVYVGSNGGTLYEFNPETGKATRVFQVTEKITQKVVYNENTKRYFVSTDANEVYCLERID